MCLIANTGITTNIIHCGPGTDKYSIPVADPFLPAFSLMKKWRQTLLRSPIYGARTWCHLVVSATKTTQVYGDVLSLELLLLFLFEQGNQWGCKLANEASVCRGHSNFYILPSRFNQNIFKEISCFKIVSYTIKNIL